MKGDCASCRCDSSGSMQTSYCFRLKLPCVQHSEERYRRALSNLRTYVGRSGCNDRSKFQATHETCDHASCGNPRILLANASTWANFEGGIREVFREPLLPASSNHLSGRKAAAPEPNTARYGSKSMGTTRS